MVDGMKICRTAASRRKTAWSCS